MKLAQSLSPQEVAHPSLDCREERLRFSARTDFANPMVKAAYQKAFFPELVPNYIDEYADGIRPRLTVALLNGDIALVGVSGEFFSNHAIRLKQRARVKQLFFFGYANGYHQYFPTIEAVAEGGYGADNAVSPAAVGAGETGDGYGVDSDLSDDGADQELIRLESRLCGHHQVRLHRNPVHRKRQGLVAAGQSRRHQDIHLV